MVVPEAQNQQNVKKYISYYVKMACTQNVAGCFSNIEQQKVSEKGRTFRIYTHKFI